MRWCNSLWIILLGSCHHLAGVIAFHRRGPEYDREPEYELDCTTRSASYERIKARAQEILYQGTANYRQNFDFIKLKKRHMYYGTKLMEKKYQPQVKYMNSSEFEKDSCPVRSPDQVVRDKEKFLRDNPDYKHEVDIYYDHLMKNRTDIFLTDEDIVKYRRMLREDNWPHTVDWNRFRQFTNTTYPPEDPLSLELHRIHEKMFRTKDPLVELEEIIRRKAEQYRREKMGRNASHLIENKVVAYRYQRRPKGNRTYLYGKPFIPDSDEYVKELINRRPKDPQNSEEPDFIKFCVNRGYNFEVEAKSTLRLKRNFTIPNINLNQAELLRTEAFDAEVDLLPPEIDEDEIRAQYSNEVDALRRLKSLERSRNEALMKQVNKLKKKLVSTTTEESVWLNHPMILSRLFGHQIVVNKCMGDNVTFVPTTVNFYSLYEMLRNTRTTDVSLLSREILRGQDTLQASQFDKYLQFMRKHKNNSAMNEQDIINEEFKAIGKYDYFKVDHDGVEVLVNNSREIMDLVRRHDEDRARERISQEIGNASKESFNVWDHWEPMNQSTTVDPKVLRAEVLYKEPASYSSDENPPDNTSDEVDRMWRRYKMEVSPDYTFDDTTVKPRTPPPSTPPPRTPRPWEVFRSKIHFIDQVENRKVDLEPTPEAYEEQHARVADYENEAGDLVRVHEIGFSPTPPHLFEDGYDMKNIVDEDKYDEMARGTPNSDQGIKLAALDDRSYMDLDPEEAVAGTLRRSNLTTLRWRAITRPCTSTTTGKRTSALWKVKSSQRYWQRLVDRKKWEIEKLHRSSTPNISTRLPIGILEEDDIYYDNIRPGAATARTVNIARLREQLNGVTASYQVGTFENLSYKSKKNAMRASIKRQRILDEYYSRKFSMTTLEPPTRRPWNFLEVSSARYYWGNVQHTYKIHFMNSSEAYEDDKQEFYARLRLNKKPKPSTSSTTPASLAAPDATTNLSKPKKVKPEKTKKTKAAGPSTTTRPQTDFPIPLMNGSYEEWVAWRKEFEEANNLVSWYSDTNERVEWYKRNKSLHTKAPIEQPGVYYESTENDYPVNCSLSLETDNPPAEEQWKRYVTWQKKHFTRQDMTIESIEEPPYAKLPFDMRTTLDSRFHQKTLVPRKTSPRILIDESEEWHKLNRAIPRKTRYPEPPPGGPTKKSDRQRRSVNGPEGRVVNDTYDTVIKAIDTGQFRKNILHPLENNIFDTQKMKNKILSDLNDLQNIQFSFRKKYSGGYVRTRPKDNGNEADRKIQDSQEADTQNDGGNNGDTTEKANDNLLNNRGPDLHDYGKHEDSRESAHKNSIIDSDQDHGNNVENSNHVDRHSIVKNKRTEPALLDIERLILHLENMESKEDGKNVIKKYANNRKTIYDNHSKSEENHVDRPNNESDTDSTEDKSKKVDESERAMIENTKMLIQYLEDKHTIQLEKSEKLSNNEKNHNSTRAATLDRANRVEFKNNLMDMPEMIELKQYIANLKKISNDKHGEHIVNEMMNEDLSRSDVVHDLKQIFGILKGNTTDSSVTDVTPIAKDEQLDSMTKESSRDEEPVLFAGDTKKESTQAQTSIKPVQRNGTNANETAKDCKDTSIDSEGTTEKLHNPVESINYDVNSNEMNNPTNRLNDEQVETLNNEYEIKQTKSRPKLEMTNVLTTLYNLVIDILKATFACIDTVVKATEKLKDKVSEEYVELKQKAHKLIKTVVLCLEVQESVINLIKYTRLQENYTHPRLSLHRLRRFVCANPIVKENYNHLQVENGGNHEIHSEPLISLKAPEKAFDTIQNDIPNYANIDTAKNELPNGILHPDTNLHHSKTPGKRGSGPVFPDLHKVGAFFHRIWSGLQNKPIRFGQDVRIPGEISQRFFGRNVDFRSRQKHRQRRSHEGRHKRDVVLTYSDESTVDPDDQWYIDLAAREFVQGRDLRDPKFNRSKIIKNMKRAGIFSVGNFSVECLSNKTWPTSEPPTTWSRNFSIRYKPSPFWNWTRYLEIHYSYMEFLFGTGTPLTTKKKKRNLTAKRQRAHQAFMEYQMRKAGNWTGADVTLIIPTLPRRNRSKDDDYEELNSELRRISRIVWSYTVTTDPGGRLYTKKKKKKPQKETQKMGSESDDVYDESSDEKHIPSTTEHIPDWDYANRMFRHWSNIRDRNDRNP